MTPSWWATAVDAPVCSPLPAGDQSPSWNLYLERGGLEGGGGGGLPVVVDLFHLEGDAVEGVGVEPLDSELQLGEHLPVRGG